MDTTGGGIPFTAWQQAVFVVLFIVLIIWLLRWQTGQQKSLQDFICKRDEQWQAWLNSRDRDYNERLNSRDRDYNQQLEKVTKALDAIAVKLDEHDDNVEKRIADIRSAADEPKTGRRPKAQA